MVTIWDFSGLTFANSISLSLLLCYTSYYTAFYTMMMNNNTNNEPKDGTILSEELQLPGLDGFAACGSITRAVPLPHPYTYSKLVQAVTGTKLRNYINRKQQIFTTNIGFVLYVA